MTRVLVTGASGQLGQSIQKLAKDYSQLTFHFTDRKTLDITNKETINIFFSNNQFDYCINCAAYTNVEQAEQDSKKAFAVNAEGVKNLALTCARHKCALIHISTDYVFDGKKENGYLPSDIPNPINEYGRSKLRGEQFLQEILEAYFIVRSSWLYSESGENFYTKILEKAKREKEIYVTDAQRGCPTHASNLARYLIDLISENKRNYGIYHFTDRAPMTWYEFALKIVNDNELKAEVKPATDDNYPTLADRPKNSVLKSG